MRLTMAMSENAKSMAQEEAKMDMTPMIDMTFLLLIFFMCNLNFKTMEGVLPSYLPKDVGIFGGAPTRSPIEPIRIKLLKTSDGAEVWMGGEQFTGENKYEYLANSIQIQASKVQIVDDKLPVIIEPETSVAFQDVVSVLNACRKVQQTPEGQNLEVRFSSKALSIEKSATD